jgi:putative ABC transport system ATP-binding protein
MSKDTFQSPLQKGPLERDSQSFHGDRQSQENGARELPVVAIRELTKNYLLGQTQIHALCGVTFKVSAGEFVAIMGPSGSGKTTLMNLIGCLDRPTSGDYWLTGVSVSHMNADRLAEIRNRRIGFVFQGFQLLPRETALANIMLPMMYAGYSLQEQERRARKALRLVGLEAWAAHLPSQLSGGQQQRIAIARALVNSPSLLLADEPTGNLDTRTSREIMTVLHMLNERGITIVVVTHNAEIAAYARRTIVLRDGRITSDEPVAASPTVSPDEPAHSREGSERGSGAIKEEGAIS